MNLKEAKEYTKHHIAFEKHKSDGCTVVPDFIFTPACQMHDMLIRFKRVSRKKADKLYLEYMLELADGRVHYIIIAYIYYLAVRYVAIFFGGDFLLALGLHGFVLVMVAIYFYEFYIK